ncbi:uncharacterized protein VTP21DRAFT_4456 [Calcarisporiella thermophila]|uniref:uncharacterized protein n=1 Tax=Calcarisporiella thermophila TaxID=911321 RepID=UPI0037433C9F
MPYTPISPKLLLVNSSATTIPNEARFSARSVKLVAAKKPADTSMALNVVSGLFSSSPPRSIIPSAFIETHHALSSPAEPLRIETNKCGVRLRPSLKAKSRSAPATPTCPKFVHFDTVEHIRLFLKEETPRSASADPILNNEEENSQEENSCNTNSGQLSISLISFPPVTISDIHRSVVSVESVYLSKNESMIQGIIAVQNLSYQKHVIVRYTFDYWENLFETNATYIPTPSNQASDPTLFDRFMFSISVAKIQDHATLLFAVRYLVGGREYWANNDGQNYQVNVTRTTFPHSPSATTPRRIGNKKANKSHQKRIELSPPGSPLSILNRDENSFKFNEKGKSEAGTHERSNGTKISRAHTSSFTLQNNENINNLNLVKPVAVEIPITSLTWQDRLDTGTITIGRKTVASSPPSPMLIPCSIENREISHGRGAEFELMPEQKLDYFTLLSKYCFYIPPTSAAGLGELENTQYRESYPFSSIHG